MHLSMFVCFFVWVCNSKIIFPIDLIFYTTIIMTVARSSSKVIRTPELYKVSSPLRDRTKYDIKVHHDVKHLL